MARTKVMRTDNDDVFNADMAVRSFCKSHKGDLSEEEHA